MNRSQFLPALRRRLRPPRRLRFTRSGWTVTLGSLVLGLAAVGTGNNLLFLLLGAVFGFITLSGWMSEQTLRGVEVRRRTFPGSSAGEPARIGYEVANRKRRLPSFAVEVGEAELPGRAWIPTLASGEARAARVEHVWERRGVYPLERVVLATSFPFGLFRKERDLELPGEVVVWPRTDLPVRDPRPAGRRTLLRDAARTGAPGGRGEFRALRPYRPGDDPRDVHWRTSVRTGEPTVREFERDRARALWLCLDLRAPEGEAAERAVATVAALAARAAGRGEAFGVATGEARVAPGAGAGQLARVLDALARARFRPDAPRVRPPALPAECVLITPGGAGGAEWGDVYPAMEGAR
ncbi:MAG TPA: DUF58 domain-containing protein [Longimicrobiaceae bacterium]|nr:DUF58 domain-containing protein [Longimicrobiaceae bacterium]